MAEAHVRVRVLALVLALFLAGLPGLPGHPDPALAQAPIAVSEAPIAHSPTGELGQADIVRAVAMIRDLGATFSALAARQGGAGEAAGWRLYGETYRRAAERLEALRGEGLIAVGAVSGGAAAEAAGDGMVLDPTLGGRWQPDQVRADRRQGGGGDWAAIGRLAAVLIEQLAAQAGTEQEGAGQESSPDWAAWAKAHESAARLQDLVGEAPGPRLRPLLLRFWIIQDMYVANALSRTDTGRTVGQLGRAAALSNEMLIVLRQAEDVAGWRWRKPLETVWSETVERTSTLAGTLTPAPATNTATNTAINTPTITPIPAPSEGGDGESAAQAPRSSDFDQLFTGSGPAAQATAAGPSVGNLQSELAGVRAETGALRDKVDALGAEAKSLRADVDGVRGNTEALRSKVDALGGEATSLRADVDSVRGDSEALRGKVDALGGEATSLRADVDSVRNETAGLHTDVENLNGEAADLRGDVDSLTAADKSVRAEVDGLRGDVKSLAGESKSVRADVDGVRGETAALRVGAQSLGSDTKSLRADVDALALEAKGLHAQVATVDQAAAERAQALNSLEADVQRQRGQVETLTGSIADQGRQLDALAKDAATVRPLPEVLAALTKRQAALEEQAAALNRDVGPEGLPKQLADLRAALGTEQGRARDSEQSLETRLQDRLRALDQEIATTRQQVRDLHAELSAPRPSRTAVSVPLRDEAARQSAIRQAVAAGLVLLGLLVAAVVVWSRKARGRPEAAATDPMDLGPDQESESDQPDTPSAAPQAAEDGALREEMARLRGAVDAERERAGAMAERLTQVGASLAESQARGRRLEAQLAAVRTATETMGRGLRDGAARDQAMEAELAHLRQAVEAERKRAAALQSRIDEIKASAAAPAAALPLNGKGHGAADTDAAPDGDRHRFIADAALRGRAIEALHRGDLTAFERTFAELTALPLPMIEEMVGEPSGHDLALACRAAEIAKPHFAAILILNRRAHPGAGQQAPWQLAQAMARYDETSDEEAIEALRAWQVQTPAGGRRANGLT